jgi:hypothetical protein
MYTKRAGGLVAFRAVESVGRKMDGWHVFLYFSMGFMFSRWSKEVSSQYYFSYLVNF